MTPKVDKPRWKARAVRAPARLFEALIVALAVGALVVAVRMEPREPKTTPEKTILVDLSASVLHVAPGLYCRGDQIDVVVVYPSDTEKGTFAGMSGSGTLRTTFRKQVDPLPLQGPTPLRFAVARGADDEAANLAAAFVTPTAIYLSAEPRVTCGERRG